MPYLYFTALIAMAFLDPTLVHAAGIESVKFIGPVTIPGLIGRLIKALFGLAGSFALIMFMFGGFTIMTAQGESEKVKKGKSMITNAILGLVAMFMSYSLVGFIIGALSSAS